MFIIYVFASHKHCSYLTTSWGCHIALQTIQRKLDQKQQNGSKWWFCGVTSMNEIIPLKHPFVYENTTCNIQVNTRCLFKDYCINGKWRRQKKTFGEFAKTLITWSLKTFEKCTNSTVLTYLVNRNISNENLNISNISKQHHDIAQKNIRSSAAIRAETNLIA